MEALVKSCNICYLMTGIKNLVKVTVSDFEGNFILCSKWVKLIIKCWNGGSIVILYLFQFLFYSIFLTNVVPKSYILQISKLTGIWHRDILYAGYDFDIVFFCVFSKLMEIYQRGTFSLANFDIYKEISWFFDQLQHRYQNNYLASTIFI